LVHFLRACVSALLILLGLFGPVAAAATAPAQAAPYIDLQAGHWAYASAQKLLESKVLSVDPEGRFRPNDPISRAELFKMVLLARLIAPNADCQGLFLDVPCTAWHARYIETAYRMGIAEGVGVKQMRPDGPVTRAQLFAVVVRGLGRRWEAHSQTNQEIQTLLAPFADRSQVIDWARPSVALALKNQIANGYSEGLLRPEQTATRAEAAAVVSRILLSAGTLQQVQVDGKKILFRRAYDMTATMYATGEPGVGTITYTGLTVRRGTVAVDPTVIPLGSLLYIEGYGYAVAADIGGGVKGEWVDMFTYHYDEAAVHFGMQRRRVWLLP
jgi:3D (Asp-Asp-Asp) domain-containing protein